MSALSTSFATGPSSSTRTATLFARLTRNGRTTEWREVAQLWVAPGFARASFNRRTQLLEPSWNARRSPGSCGDAYIDFGMGTGLGSVTLFASAPVRGRQDPRGPVGGPRTPRSLWPSA